MTDDNLIKYAKLVQKFESTEALREFVVSDLVQEFEKPGLILLPTGRTFEYGIYPQVNKFFDEYVDEELDVSNKNKIHPGLKLSHLDERITIEKKHLFSEHLKGALSNLVDKFYFIDIDKPKDFDQFIKAGGGPRLIYMGLGSDPTRAHVAYIGEDYINNGTEVVNLSYRARPELESGELPIKEALTIGVDIFESSNLEEIRIVVIGQEKAMSLRKAFEDADTGLGYLIEHFNEKLAIFCDPEAAALIKDDLYS